MEKMSCTLGFPLILFVERELFKYKHKINILSLPAALFACRSCSKYRINEQLPVFFLFFFYFDWLLKAFRTNHNFFQSLHIILTHKMKAKVKLFLQSRIKSNQKFIKCLGTINKRLIKST